MHDDNRVVPIFPALVDSGKIIYKMLGKNQGL